jgi:hypothetical protein
MGSGASTLPSNQVKDYPTAHLRQYEEGCHWKMDKDSEAEPKLPLTGEFADLGLGTICDLLEKATKKCSERSALAAELPVPALVNGIPPPALPADEWTTWTWNQFMADVKKLAKCFMNHGVEQFDSITVFGPNSPFWMMSIYAASYVGAKSAGVYPSDTPEQLQFKAFHSDSAGLVLEGDEQLAKLEKVSALHSTVFDCVPCMHACTRCRYTTYAPSQLKAPY